MKGPPHTSEETFIFQFYWNIVWENGVSLMSWKQKYNNIWLNFIAMLGILSFHFKVFYFLNFGGGDILLVKINKACYSILFFIKIPCNFVNLLSVTGEIIKSWDFIDHSKSADMSDI